jgi:RNA polymerase sigma-70 factor (ECF subfamily)
MTIGNDFPAVLDAARTGAGWALAVLYRDLQPRLLRYLALHEPTSADDLASEVWIGVARGLRRFSGDEDDFRAWIFTIARRRMLDLRRKVERRRAVSVPPDVLAALGGATGDAEEEAVNRIEADRTISRLTALSPDQADVLFLRVVAGLSVSEVAEVLAKRQGTIRVLQHRALRGLAQQGFDGRQTE